MSAPAQQKTSTCATREWLADQFRMQLDVYYQKLKARLDEMGDELAIELTKADFNKCVEIRTALRVHENDHGCAPSSCQRNRALGGGPVSPQTP